MRNSAASLIIAAAIIVAASLNVFVTSAHQAPTALFCVLIILSALRLAAGAVFVVGTAATVLYFPAAKALDIPLDSWQWNVAALVVATALGMLFATQRESYSRKQRETIRRARQSERERDALRARQSRLRAVLRHAPVVVFHQDKALRYRWVEGLFPANGTAEVVGKTDQQLFRHDEAERLADLKREAMEQECVVREDVLLTGPGGPRFFDLTVAPLHDPTGDVVGVTGAAVDITDRKQVEDEMIEAVARQRAVADLALRALVDTSGDLQALFDEATAALAYRLDVDYGLLLETHPSGESLVLRSGAGWPLELLGSSIENANGTSQMGYVLHSIVPVVANDLVNDTRFEPASILRERGVVSGASVALTAGGRRVGILGAYSTEQRRFDDDDVGFLSGVAEVLAAAVERAESETYASEQERALRSLFENSPDVVCAVDRRGRLLSVNPAGEQLFARLEEDLRGIAFATLVMPEQRETIAEALRQAGDGQPLALECAVVRADGRRVDLHGSATPIASDGETSAVYLVLQDVSDQLALEAQLARQMLRDPLTRLPNRTLLVDRLTHALARAARQQSVTAVLMIQLDRLPEINARFGRDAGDRVLLDVAARLQRGLRPGDTVARLGGDEFAIVLEDVDGIEGSVTVAQRIASALREPFLVADAEFGLAAAIGIALGVAASNSADELLKKAESARERARARLRAQTTADGDRSLYEIFDANLTGYSIAERLRLESDLAGALDRDEFVLLYEPIKEIGTDRVVAYEAIIQWDHPSRGSVPMSMLSATPAVDLLAVAEATGLSVPIGRWALREACHQGRLWQPSAAGDGAVLVAVNLSSRHLHHPELLNDVAGVLTESGLAATNLVLEVSERVLMADIEFAVDRITALRALGVAIAIDDFGSGPFSLPHVQRLGADYLKLDPRLTDRLTAETSDLAFVAGMASLGHALGAKLVAQRVASAEQLARLREAGCDLAQGPLLGEPRPAGSLSLLRSAPHRS